MTLTDRSDAPRSGVKGKATTTRLRAAGATIPEVNAAAPQSDGSLLVRLGENEYLVLGTGSLLAEITAFRMGGENEDGLAPVPRLAGTTWLVLSGERLAELIAKLCSVDLRPRHFPNHRVAQTIVARTTAIVIRDDAAAEHSLHLVFDATTTAYLREVLADAMAEYE